MLTTIQTAEQSLLSSVLSTTAALDAVATAPLESALADLERAAQAAGDRLQEMACRYHDALAGLVSRLGVVAEAIAQVGSPKALATAPGEGAVAAPATVSGGGYSRSPARRRSRARGRLRRPGTD